MLRSIMIAAAATGLLAVGALTAAAANSHGNAVSDLARSTTLKGEAKGDAVSTLASSTGTAKSAAAKADSAADAVARAADDATASGEDKDVHGDAVSKVARSDAKAAQPN